MHRQRLLVQTFEPSVIPQGRKLVATHPHQRTLKRRGFGEMIGQMGPHNGAARHAQRLFKHRVGKLHRTSVVHHSNQGGE